MKGTYLRFYVLERRKVHGIAGYEWLLETARKAGVVGGTAFRAMAGFGRGGVMHEDSFFELAGDVPVEVGFALSDEQAEQLLQRVREAKLPLFYVRGPVEFGVIDGALPQPPHA